MIKRALPPMVSLLAVFLCACSTAIPYDNADQAGTLAPPDAVSSLPAETQHSVAAQCPPLNSDPADTSVTYASKQQGISFTIPYNAKWGYANNPMPAYEAHAAQEGLPYGYVSFGPLHMSNIEGMAGDCSIGHSYQLTFLKARSVEQAVKDIEGGNSEITPITQTRAINGLTVVQYTGAGLCSDPTMEVVGQKYNYEFSTDCGQNSSEEWQYLENIVKSVKLLK